MRPLDQYKRLMGVLARRAGLRAFRFFLRPIDGGTPLPSLPGIEFRLVPEEEALQLCSDAELDLSREMVRRACAQGDLCVGAFEAGRVTGYCWLAFAPVPHLDGVWVDFDRGAVWIYKSFVRPACRGRGIASALYRFADGAAAERGRSHSIVCVESHNGSSIGAARKASYADAGRAAYLKGRRSFRAWYSAASRRLGVRLFVPT